MVLKWDKRAKKLAGRLPQPIRYFLPRLLASFFIIVTVLTFVVWLPTRAADKQLQLYIDQAAKQESLIETAAERLKIIPLPADMDPPSPKARQQAETANTHLRKLQSKPIQLPRSLPERSERLKQFNKIINSQKHPVAFNSAQKALNETRSLMAYHAEVLEVISKLMEYRAAVDIAPDDNVILAKRLEATGEGLQSLSQRLNSLSGYDDKGLEAVKLAVAVIEVQRQGLLGAVKSTQAADKQPFIAAVADAQQKIMANRQDFWLQEREKNIAALQKAKTDYGNFSHQLKALR